MEVIKSDVKGWKRAAGGIQTGEGLMLGEEQQKNVSRLYDVPGALLNVDSKYNVSTFIDVLKVVPEAEKMSLLVENSKVLAVIDPKSKFISDDEYAELVKVCDKLEMNKREASYDGNRVTEYRVSAAETDNILGDLFNKNIQISRLNEGGISINAGLLRLKCTNGMMLVDKQFRKLKRTSVPDEATIMAFGADVIALNLENYLRNLWMKDGEFVQASVSDYLSMRNCLTGITDAETADIYFPLDPIEEHYSAQNIDIHKINDRLRSRMPSGVSYYNCFNFLTNGAKAAENLTLHEKIQIGNFANPVKLEQIKASAITFHGIPHFSESQIAILQGDKEE